MGAQENKQTAQEAYAAFSKGDAEGAMRNIDDSIEWIVRGDNSLTGTHKGKQAVGELWGKYLRLLRQDAARPLRRDLRLADQIRDVLELAGRHHVHHEHIEQLGDFVADGDTVVVLTTARLAGESVESADVLTYNADGKLVKFDTLSDETVPNRVYAK